jgi:hypothetical protein
MGASGQQQANPSADLRPNWAKPANETASAAVGASVGAQVVGAVIGATASAPGTRDFPTLAASVASQNRNAGSDGVGSLKPQSESIFLWIQMNFCRLQSRAVGKPAVSL